MLALIPARGGSKGIPLKNLTSLAGQPLIYYSIVEAQACEAITQVVVTTDSPEIADYVKGLNVEVLMRPKDLAADDTRMEDVVQHALSIYSCNEFVLLQPTSPLRKAEHITQAINTFKNAAAVSLVSMTECEVHPFKSCYLDEKEQLRPTKTWQMLGEPRQRLPKALHPNGAIYIANREEFLKERSFFLEPLHYIVMDSTSSIDIDSPADLLKAGESLTP